MQKPSTPHTKVVKSSDGAQTATNNSAKFNNQGYNGFVAYLNVSAASGTTPSMTVKFQDSPDGTNWFDIASAAFTAATGAVTQRLVVSNTAQYVRAVSTITGTTPSFTYDLDVSGIG